MKKINNWVIRTFGLRGSWTLPDDYLDGIAPNTAMSLAGNGWTVDVIAHLLRSIERKQINDIVKEFRKITDELMFGSLETDIM